MAKQDPQYRANPERGIFITGQLDDALLAEVSPRILEFRKDPTQPISVFINSPGGSIRILDVLDGLLRSPDADGRNCRVVTVALGDANSAAATLLALGDYAVAYSHSRMHFHGSRLPVVEELTAEKATDRAGRLASLNRNIAMRLAKVVLGRLVLRYNWLFPELETARQRLNLTARQPIACFVDCLKRRVSHAGDRILVRAARHMERLARISNALAKLSIKPSDNRLAADVKVFRKIFEFEIREHRKQDWCLDEVGMQDVVADYLLLRDYVSGEHVKNLDLIINRYGPSFLEEARFEEYKAKHAASPKDAQEWLRPLVEWDIREFWYFTVCLCRLMQEGENPLDATDAYWLGVVDEVLGTDQHGARSLMEVETTNPPNEELPNR